MKMSIPYITFLYQKQVPSQEEGGGPGLIVMLGAIASKAFIELLFLLLLFLLVPWLQSYIHLIISSSSLPQVLLFSLHDFAEHEAFRNTHIYIAELPIL